MCVEEVLTEMSLPSKALLTTYSKKFGAIYFKLLEYAGFAAEDFVAG
jgi:hypothetical protein